MPGGLSRKANPDHSAPFTFEFRVSFRSGLKRDRVSRLSRNDSPAFQFYPKDILSDENVVLMDLDTVGGYVYLLCYCWLQGSLPAEPESLRKLAHCGSDRWPEMWPQIKPCFRSNGRGRLWHPRLKREKAKQVEWKQKSQEGGIASAKSRQYKQLAKGGSTKGQAGGARVVQPKANSSSSSPSSTPDKNTKPKKVSADKPPTKQQLRVQSVLDICPPMKPARAAALLKAWDSFGGDETCLKTLAAAIDQFPLQPPNYILQVVETARRNGGSILGTRGQEKPDWREMMTWLDENNYGGDCETVNMLKEGGTSAFKRLTGRDWPVV